MRKQFEPTVVLNDSDVPRLIVAYSRIVVPSPISPAQLDPQQRTVPSARTAQVWELPAAIAMAEGARRVLGSDVALSLTGVAGPSEQDGQSVGTLWVGVALPGQVTTATALRMPGQRDQMRQMSVISALDLLRRRLLGR